MDCFINEPIRLVEKPYVFPRPEMSDGDRIDSLMRLVIIISTFMFLFMDRKCLDWLFFFISGLLFIFIIYLYSEYGLTVKLDRPLEPEMS